MINNCWNLKGDTDHYKKFEKGWSAENPAKPGKVMQDKTPLFHEDKPVRRSGVASEANPLVTTASYYSQSFNAARSNTTAQAMHGGPPQQSKVMQNYQAAIKEQMDFQRGAPQGKSTVNQD